MSDNTNHATVSLKGAGRDALWIVLNGSAEDMVRQVKDIFNFPEEETAGLDPVELFINADSTLKALTTVGSELGGTIIKSPAKINQTGGWHGEAEKAHAEDPQGGAWERAGAQPDESDVPAPMPVLAGADDGSRDAVAHPYQALILKLGAAASIQELQGLWSENRSAFQNDDVVAAYKARGTELKKLAGDG